MIDTYPEFLTILREITGYSHQQTKYEEINLISYDFLIDEDFENFNFNVMKPDFQIRNK